MEKYSKWRDQGTGIQPFLQPVPARSEKQGLKVVLNAAKKYIVGPVVATMRLALLGALAVVDAATAAVGALVVVPSIKRMWTWCTRSVWARMALLVLGFYSVDTKTVSLQKGRRDARKNAASKKGGVRSGDIIVANHASYVDILYLVAKYAPVFVELDNATMCARPISMWTALRAPAQMTPALLQAKDARPLKTITEEARAKRCGPVVVFPENATTNGRALLQLLPVFGEYGNLDEKSNIHIVAFKYPFQSFSPAYSVGNQAAHLFGLCCQFYNSITVRVLDPNEAPRVADSPMFCDSSEAEPVDIDEDVGEKLLQLSRLRMTKMTAMDKRDFLTFYHKRAKGYGKNANGRPVTI
ncbi:Vacuolar protein sorting protein vps66 [Coemansia sp. RSA 1813]|nr:Lysophosphatidic acid:oleoyl-CoA acyltransferase 1 [Coemansia sp. RSA 1646]KAJ1772201.1 Vacuolar protein sorting protein vps66 [Coemansia sp. RSA 1843]KAJ2091833.1 Vacuolar protein sorting protein vps66 [Coemansia sp. RSA 986]KAJ2215840.1 Vacuolar protein sorting protein vps66 [Coemansia sp. RSA 487]KAJ2571771.1 Vacuolar protein sorting protein vps66 [Coemansia sp. RSA 1813]